METRAARYEENLGCAITLFKIAMMIRLAINKQMFRAVSPCALDSILSVKCLHGECECMALVSMIYVVHCLSDRLLQCFNRTYSYPNVDENTIYWSALVET